MQFVSSEVIDSYTDTAELNGRSSSYSIFDQDLEHYESKKLFTLNILNFHDDWRFLLPRAIGYSAGLINYFFRGRLDVRPDPDNAGYYLVTNISNYPMTDGTLRVYYDDTGDTRHLLESTTGVTMSHTGDTYKIQIDPPTDSDPAPKVPGQYMLVFKGQIGSEGGIVGKQFKAQSNPLFYATFDRSCSVNPYWGCSTVFKYSGDFSFSTFEPIDDHDNSSIDQMAVYDGTDYTIDYLALPGGSWNTVAKFNNKEVLFGFPTGSGSSTVLEGIAVNSKYAYVASLDRPSWIENIHVYDHDANYVGLVPDVPMQALSSFAANDDHFCLSGWDHGGTDPATVLTDLSGNVLARWPGDPDDGGGPCALTRDRAYGLLWSVQDHDAGLDVYDMNGKQIASLDVSGTNWYESGSFFPYAVSATDSKVYIRADCYCMTGQIIITYKRVVTRDKQGNITSENFIRQPDMTVFPQTWNSYLDLIQDMKDVLGTPAQ